MDGGAAGNGCAPGQPGVNGTSVTMPTSQPSPAGWGMGGSLGEGAGQPGSGQQQWAAHSRGHSGLRDALGATMWPAWPANNGELTAENKVRPLRILSSSTPSATCSKPAVSAAGLPIHDTVV